VRAVQQALTLRVCEFRHAAGYCGFGNAIPNETPMNRKSFLASLLLWVAGFLPAAWRLRVASVMRQQPQSASLGMYYTPAKLLSRLLVCDPACGTGDFLVQAKVVISRGNDA
jgi:hypothetical protein